MSVCLPACLSVDPSARSSVRACPCSAIRLLLCMPACTSVRLSVRPSIPLSVRPVCLSVSISSVRPSVNLSILLGVCGARLSACLKRLEVEMHHREIKPTRIDMLAIRGVALLLQVVVEELQIQNIFVLFYRFGYFRSLMRALLCVTYARACLNKYVCVSSVN